jgi:two-component system chemotaxis sensor kinase CheA
MDVVRASLQKMGGIVEIQSTVGKGSSISIRLPLTLAIIPAIILAAEDQCFAVPQVSVLEVVWLHGDEVYQSIQKIDESEVYWLRGKMLPLLRLSQVLQIQRTFVDPVTAEEKPERRAASPDRRQKGDGFDENQRTGPRDRRTSLDNSLYIIVLRVGSDSFGLCVERIVDTEEIVVKPLHDRLKASKVYAGVTVLGDGNTALILDVAELALTGGIHCEKNESRAAKPQTSLDELQKILVFTNGVERFALPLCLLMRVDEIPCKEIQVAGGHEFLRFRDSLIPLVRIEQALPGLSCHYDDEFIHAIIPKIGQPVGIAAARIIEIASIDNNTQVHPMDHKAIIGSQMVNGYATTLLDLCALVEAVEPQWLASLEQVHETKPRILLAEDSSLYRTLVTSYLQSMGLEVLAAVNGREALELMRKNVVDCVVSDIEMPVMDGLDLARQVKADDALRMVPLLGISSVDEKTMRPRALDAGFDEFRSKNNLPLLGEAIEALLADSARRSTHG